jgi:hypothetical protein
MSSSPAVFDPSTLGQIAESIDPSQVVETSDYSDSILIPVGRYISTSRSLQNVEKRDDGTASVTLSLTGGITSDSGVTFGGGQYPLRAWVNSKLFSFQGQPGSTSSLAQYLKACGFETAGKTVAEMLLMVPETLTMPVYVKIGRTDKAVKQDDGSYKSAGLKTKDFVIGNDEQGNRLFGATATKDGVTYAGKPRVEGFSRIR